MKEMPKKELGTGRVAFKARIEEIKKEIETGRTVMSVYREFGHKVGIGYSQFDRYVKQFIRSKPIYEKEGDKPTAKPAAKGPEPKQRKEPFMHDANSGNTDEFI